LSPALARLLSEVRAALSNPDLPRERGAEVRERLADIEDTSAISRLLALLHPGDPHDLRSAIIYKLEQFPPASYFEGLLDALPDLCRRAPGWAFVALVRIVNTRAGGRNSYASRFESAVKTRSADLRRLVLDTLERHRHAVEGEAAENIGRTLQALTA
jgi:hypothetical protein